MEISKTSQKLHFRVTKKDPDRAYILFSYFKLVQILVKPYLGFDQDSNGHKISKKNEKPKHIAFLCHIVSTQVDKQGLDIFKPEKSCIYP
jgi:hypothetical protein